MQQFPVGAGQGPHDVAPAADGGVWYTAQRTGELVYLEPKTGAYRTTKPAPAPRRTASSSDRT